MLKAKILRFGVIEKNAGASITSASHCGLIVTKVEALMATRLLHNSQ